MSAGLHKLMVRLFERLCTASFALILLAAPGASLAQAGPVQTLATEIRSAAWFRDEKYFAAVLSGPGSSAASDMSVVLWDAATGRVVDRIRFPDVGDFVSREDPTVTSIFIRAMEIVPGYGGGIRVNISTSIKNAASGTCSNFILFSYLNTNHNSWQTDDDLNTPASCLLHKRTTIESPSGKFIVSATSRGLAIFRQETRKPFRMLEDPQAFPGGGEPTHFAGIGDAISLRFPSIVLQTQPPADEAKLALWTPDEKLVVAVMGAKGSTDARDHSLLVWNFRSGEIVNRVEFPDLGSGSSVFVHNMYIAGGARIELRASLKPAAGAGCESIVMIYKFDQQSGWTSKSDLNRLPLCVVEYPPNPKSPSGTLALSETQAPLAVVRPGTREIIAALDKPEALVITDAALSPDGNTMALVAGQTEGHGPGPTQVIVFDLKASRIREVLLEPGVPADRVQWLDDRQFALLSQDGTGPVQTVDARTGLTAGAAVSGQCRPEQRVPMIKILGVPIPCRKITGSQDTPASPRIVRLFSDPDGYWWVDYDEAAASVYRVDARRGSEERTILGQNVVAAGKFLDSPLTWFATRNSGLLWLSPPAPDRSAMSLAVTNFFKGGKFFSIRGFGYDTNLPADTDLFRWVNFGDGMKTLGPQTYLRTSYQPQLARRMIECERTRTCGDAFPEEWPKNNTTLPVVTIDRVVPGGEPNTAIVEISVSGGKGSGRRGFDDNTGAYNLRLFRNGALVAQYPKLGVDEELSEIETWRERNLVTLDTNGTQRVSLPVVLPTGSEAQTIALTAYAFNEDRVKSETVSAEYIQPAVAKPRPRRAFVVTFGIDEYDDEKLLDLQFAGSDARLLGERLARIPGYEVQRAIIARDPESKKPVKITQLTIARVIAILRGVDVKAAKKALRQQGFDASKLEPPTPDDIVILSFAGHGWADKTGAFYLVPSDARWLANGEPDRKTLISAVQMADRLREVDAGEMAMIIDACHSAASVDAGGFKPGPMGDPGLGQLAFDKGIRILAATQADVVALEDPLLRQGLLTYALASEGITATGGKADSDGDGRITLDEWLGYATRRMPSLSSDVRLGRLVSDASGARGWVSSSSQSKPPIQEPALFDFNSRPSNVVLREKVGR